MTCNFVHFFRISFDIPESWLESFQDLRARCQCQIRSEAIIGIHPDLLSSLAEVTYILDMLFEYRYRPLMQISLWKHQLRQLYQMLETSSIRWCPVALVIGPNWVGKYIITRNTVYVVSDAPLAEFDSLAGAKQTVVMPKNRSIRGELLMTCEVNITTGTLSPMAHT